MASPGMMRMIGCAVAAIVASTGTASGAVQQEKPPPGMAGVMCMMDSPRIYGTVCWYRNVTYCACPPGLQCRDQDDFDAAPRMVGTCRSKPNKNGDVAAPVTPAAIVNAQLELEGARAATVDIRGDIAALQRQLANPELTYGERQALMKDIRTVGVKLDDALAYEVEKQERLIEIAAMLTYSLRPNQVHPESQPSPPLYRTTEMPEVEKTKDDFLKDHWYYLVAGGVLLLVGGNVSAALVYRSTRKKEKQEDPQEDEWAKLGKALSMSQMSGHYRPPSAFSADQASYFAGGESVHGVPADPATIAMAKGSSKKKSKRSLRSRTGSVKSAAAGYLDTRPNAETASFYHPGDTGSAPQFWMGAGQSSFSPPKPAAAADRGSHFFPGGSPNIAEDDTNFSAVAGAVSSAARRGSSRSPLASTDSWGDAEAALTASAWERGKTQRPTARKNPLAGAAAAAGRHRVERDWEDEDVQGFGAADFMAVNDALAQGRPATAGWDRGQHEEFTAVERALADGRGSVEDQVVSGGGPSGWSQGKQEGWDQVNGHSFDDQDAEFGGVGNALQARSSQHWGAGEGHADTDANGFRSPAQQIMDGADPRGWEGQQQAPQDSWGDAEAALTMRGWSKDADHQEYAGRSWDGAAARGNFEHDEYIGVGDEQPSHEPRRSSLETPVHHSPEARGGHVAPVYEDEFTGLEAALTTRGWQGFHGQNM